MRGDKGLTVGRCHGDSDHRPAGFGSGAEGAVVVEPQIVAVSRRLRWEPPFNLALRPETLFPAD